MSQFSHRICSLLGFTAAVLLLSSSTTKAAFNSWNVSTGDWSDTNPSPWTLGTEPTNSDDVYIQNGGTANITQASEYCSSLYLGASGTGNDGTIDMSGGSLSISNYSYIGYSGIGTFTQTGGTNSIYNDDYYYCGFYCCYNSNASGTYNLSGTGQLDTNNCEYIGYAGTGIFTQSGGINNLIDDLFLGYNSNAAGIYNLSGDGQLSIIRYGFGNPCIFIGFHGIGMFNQTGGMISNPSLVVVLGDNLGSNGMYNLSDTGKVSAYNLCIGNIGTGMFNQTGGTNSSANVTIGSCSGSTGAYNLSGTGQLTVYRYEYIGSNGTGIFTQSGGMHTIASGYLYLGYNTGSNGTYNLSGTADLSCNYYEYIGYSGTGMFNQTGGIHENSSICLGYNSGSRGTYNLKGGLLILNSLYKGFGTATFYFGGGTLQAGTNVTCFLPMILTGDGGNANVDTLSYTVTLSGILSGTGGLNKLGSGTLTLDALNTYAGNTTINGGTLVLAGGIDPSGTSLIDVQSGTAILKTVNVNKTNLNINTAPSAIFEIVNCSYTIGAISGSGTTKIDAGASLTAQSITQGTLTIGSGATLTIQAIPGGPLGNSITPVPEPSIFVLLSAAFITAIYAWARKRIG